MNLPPKRSDGRQLNSAPAALESCLLQHFLITRFNVRIDRTKCLDPDWLRGRFALFERFCFPSLQAQVCQEFGWLVLFDQATPAEFRQRIRRYRAWTPFTPIFVDSSQDSVSSLERLRQIAGQQIGARLADTTRWVMTSRCDSDDALARHFTREVRQQARAKFEFLSFGRGYTWFAGQVTRSRNHPLNQFLTLVERVQRGQPLLTIYCRQHTEVSSVAPMRVIGGRRPAWMSVVHGGNSHHTPCRLWKRRRWDNDEVARDDFEFYRESGRDGLGRSCRMRGDHVEPVNASIACREGGEHRAGVSNAAEREE